MTEIIRNKIHSHRHCGDCGKFIKTVRCDFDHEKNLSPLDFLCDNCYKIYREGDDFA